MPNFPFFVARRYLVSKKSYNVINLISYISIISISFGTTALIVVLSVYNGFDEFIKSMYSAFDPDFRITLAKGKVFSMDNDTIREALNDEAVLYHSPILEETALIEYDDRQTIAKMKGVGAEYHNISKVDSAMKVGFYMPKSKGVDYACLGNGVAYRISFNLDFQRRLRVWMPRRGKKIVLDPGAAFNTLSIMPSGVFSLEPEFDSEYFITPISFAQDLLDYDSAMVSHIEIRTVEDTNMKAFQKRLSQQLGDRFVVKNKYQQRELLYKIMQSERWAIFMILFFILIIASFNILASLSMLIIDKRKDIATLKSMGANKRKIRHIFVWEGWMITGIGGILGLIQGYVVVWVQETFGIVSFPTDSFLLDAYPVKIILSDFFLVLATVGTVGFVATYLPARFITSRQFRIEG